MVLRRDKPYARIVVPDHKEIRPGTLHRILSDSGLTIEEFQRLLRA
jgi:predicted RNA binding protein YcfA (HicA-like mRNA interferase family)